VIRSVAAAWVLLAVAGLLEVVWAIALKESEGFTRLWPGAVTAVALAGSMVLLALAMQRIPVGTAYPVWVGIGALGTAVVGVLRFGEPLTAARGVFLVMLVASIIGLKLTSGRTE
jgi:quaternary ammonium compound-resistance protein SugE